MSLFTTKKPRAKTIALIDIQSSSVAGGLVHLSQKEPKLFGEKRTFLKIPQLLRGEVLLHLTTDTTKESLLHMSEVAARMRTHTQLVSMGEVDQVIVFFGPPWAKMDLTSSNSFHANIPQGMAKELRAQIASILGDVDISFHSFATAATRITQRGIPTDPYLLCTITEELTELTLLQEGHILAHVTFPVGLHTLLRTLVVHGGFSYAEAYSALKLPTPSLQEALRAMSDHFSDALYHALRDIGTSSSTCNIFVLSHEPHGEWFAQAIVSDPKVSSLFREGVVRTLRPAHLSPLLAAHGTHPDLFLMLEALFVDVRHGV